MKNTNVLLFDIETSPSLAWVWRTGKQYVGHDQLRSSCDIICICYKWADKDTVHKLDWGYHEQNSEKMISTFSKVVEKADLVVGQNSDRFDIKHINTQRLLKGKKPVLWPATEDTLKQLRKTFYLPSYKLDYVAKLLTGSGKDKMCFQDWIDIVEKKNKKSFRKMISYCANDVIKLQQVWERIKIHCKPTMHMGIAAGVGRSSCPRCAAENPIKYGFRYTNTGKYQRFQCVKCGNSWKETRNG